MTNNTTAALTDEQRKAVECAIELIENDHGDRTVTSRTLRALLTSPRAAVPAPEGWKLVPIEPTDEMVESGHAEYERALIGNRKDIGVAFLRRWAAMLDAAPAAPVAEAGPQWLPINLAPDDDELIWLMKGDSIEGPRRIHPNDYDRYTHYAPCEAPNIKSIAAQAVAADGAQRMFSVSDANALRTAIDAAEIAKFIDAGRAVELREIVTRAVVSPATADERAAFQTFYYSSACKTVDECAPIKGANYTGEADEEFAWQFWQAARASQAAAPAEAREPDAYMTLDCVSLKPASVYLDREEIADMRPDHVVPLYRAAVPADAGEAVLTAAARDVLAERARQVSVEGWTPEHDDQYTKGELALAASQYVLHVACPFQDGKVPAFWPWPAEWWKPTTPRRDLEKAGALIQAEIERRYRAEACRDALDAAQGAQGGKGGEA
ncbi:hypothetical protein [Burkholderia gladioli]|uniref:hypothetical protein n=1 Tax=Burkholderia gladioli TaxID=28095 RepID=UPI00164102A0|nr:hypothetical protein [Burkholderia gladioli]